MRSTDLMMIYEVLSNHFGAQGWWPAETRFDIVVGAILTQRTIWRNAARVIKDLKRERLTTPNALANVDPDRLEALVRPAGFYRQKTQRLIELARFIVEKYGGSLERLFEGSVEDIRGVLTSLKGIGLETADSILLYAADILVFPIDTYTRRICHRLELISSEDMAYEALKELFEGGLPSDLRIYKEFRALLVRLGKTYCRPRPLCRKCPLRELCYFAQRL